eukprot:SAG31_NODE_4630_length_3085_cov_2.376758_1_plen_88_part_00
MAGLHPQTALRQENSTNTANRINGGSWVKHSLSYWHNRLWTGNNESDLFSQAVNDSAAWETLACMPFFFSHAYPNCIILTIASAIRL